MTVSWVCGVCGSAVNGDAYDPWCETCGEDRYSIPATHFQPEPLSRDQYIAICRHFTAQGEVNRDRRMRRLTAFTYTQGTGRDIHDYWDLTSDEAAALLKEWAHGIRR
jgi:hypothetical protein